MLALHSTDGGKTWASLFSSEELDALVASLPGDVHFANDKLRYRLPQLAYYFSNGPWRMCWIAFGYDPRKSTDGRVYQVLDLRLPPSPALDAARRWSPPAADSGAAETRRVVRSSARLVALARAGGCKFDCAAARRAPGVPQAPQALCAGDGDADIFSVLRERDVLVQLFGNDIKASILARFVEFEPVIKPIPVAPYDGTDSRDARRRIHERERCCDAFQ